MKLNEHRKTSNAMDDDDEMPEIDFSKCVIVRRGAVKNRRLSLSILRGSQGLTQTELAARAGLTQSEVSRAEMRKDCLVSTLERYAKALGGELLLFVEINGRKYPIKLSD